MTSNSAHPNMARYDHFARGAGSAHGKVILLGEHAVVYGAPAIAVPLPGLPVTATARPATAVDHSPMSGPRVAVNEAVRRWKLRDLEVQIVFDCAIPPAAGLGSSAACAGAAVRAVADLCGRTLDSQSLYDLIQYGEQFAHGRASGVDTSAVLSDQPIWFHAGTSRPLRIGVDAALVIAHSGTTGGTADAVAAVRSRFDGDGRATQLLLDRAAALTLSAAADLEEGRAKPLGKKLLAFHGVLVELGVSTTVLDSLIEVALDAGALGAKLTGAGRGGSVLALVDTASVPRVSTALRLAGAAQTWTVPIRGGQL